MLSEVVLHQCESGTLKKKKLTTAPESKVKGFHHLVSITQ